MDDALAKATRPLNVLTARDHARRLVTLATHAAGVGLMAAIIAPYAIANATLFLGVGAAYAGLRSIRKVFTRSAEPSEQTPDRNDAPKYTIHTAQHFAKLAKCRLPNVIRLEAPDTCAQAVANVSYVTPQIGFTRAMEREYGKLGLVAFLGHEVGHISHDNRILDDANSVMLFGGRALRWGMVAGMVAGALPVTPVIAGVAALMPLLMHVAFKHNARHNELINDRFAAMSMGTPVPLANAFAKHKRAVEQSRLISKFAPALKDGSGEKETVVSRAVRSLEIFENSGIFATHPSNNFRRLALGKLRTSGKLKPQDSQTKTILAMLD